MHITFNFKLIAILLLDYCYRRKTGFTQVRHCKWHKNTRALQPTNKKSDQALTQNKMSELGLHMLFKMRSEERSINCSASRNVNL